MPDLIGIGSINVDLVVESAAGTTVDLADSRLALTADDIGGERAIDAEASAAALDYLARFDPVTSAGGSSLNVVAAVAGTGAPVSVGQVGVCGTDDIGGFSFAPWFAKLAIDTTYVERVPGRPGLCLAVTRDGERTLLTTGGVNDQLGRLLRGRADDIARYLAEARIVHVTSLAGLEDLSPLVDLLSRVRSLDPTVRLSCDPGAIWTAPDHAPEVDAILARCHQLLVNGREFAALGGRAVLDRLPALDLVVVKGAEAVELHDRDRRVVHPNPMVLRPDQIVDDTGAGDAFAAGFLIGQLLDGIDRAGGVRLGMDLARAKLGFTGMSAVDRFAEVYRRVPRPLGSG